jgi:hypothetical protein
MKLRKKILIPALVFMFAAFALTSCKVGEDDPLVAIKSRTERFSQYWELQDYQINDASQNLTNSSMSWDADKNGIFEEKIQGELFGFQTLETNNGSWKFVSEVEAVEIAIEGDVETYTLDRLSPKDLWVRRIDGQDVHEMIFERK